ncbi:MAG: GntR family transcriptional regulator [Colwellia sp.]|nr:GntR family transcriptional regulator [Colwellia sp.]
MIQFNIEASSGIPIYKQIFEQVERMIANGYLVEGTLLPSVRQVANNIDVNPMTISKAYGLLEERGYLTRLRGKGMMVAHQSEEKSKKEKMMILDKMIAELVSDAVQMGINKQELLTLIADKAEQLNLPDKINSQG